MEEYFKEISARVIANLISDFIKFLYKKFQLKLAVMRGGSLRGKNSAKVKKGVQAPLSFSA